MEFLNSLKKRSKHYSTPFSHWELNEPLTKEAIKEICKTEIVDLGKININYDQLEYSISTSLDESKGSKLRRYQVEIIPFDKDLINDVKIIIKNKFGLTYDPIPEEIPENMFFKCKSSEELELALKKFLNLSQNEISLNVKTGRLIREQYFEPFSEEGLNRFLDIRK